MSVRKLPEALQKKAEEELYEVPSRIQADIDHISDWLTKQPHLNVPNDDQSLLTFLRHSKFSLERTKAKLESYYTMKSMMSDIFGNRDPFLPEIQEILRRGMVTFISDPSDPLCPVVVPVCWKRGDPDKVTVINVFKVMLMGLDILINEGDAIVINGLHYLVDFEQLHTMYVAQLTPAAMKKVALCLLDMYPIRMKGDHVIHASPITETFLNVLKGFLKEKLKKRSHFYRDLGFIHRDIPLSVLPDEYGGTAGSIDEHAAQWKEKIESYRDWFLEEQRYRNDESKRMGAPKTEAELTGVEGSFRKLQVD